MGIIVPERHWLDIAYHLSSSAALLEAYVASSAWRGAILEAFAFACLTALTLWAEFGFAARETDHLYRCRPSLNSTGIASGLLALPTLTLALARTSGREWLPHARCSLVMSFALLAFVQLSPYAAIPRKRGSNAAGTVSGVLLKHSEKHAEDVKTSQAANSGTEMLLIPFASLIGIVLTACAASKHSDVWPERRWQQQTLLLEIIGACACCVLMHAVLISLPFTFTIGEACTASEAATLLVISFAEQLETQTLLQFTSFHGYSDSDAPGAENTFVVCLLGSTLLLTAAVRVAWVCRRSVLWADRLALAASLLCSVMSFTALCALAAWTLAVFLPAETHRMYILGFWLATLSCSIVVMGVAVKRSQLPQIIVRKGYHLLAVMLFLPVLFRDPSLLCVALAVAFALLVFLEIVRQIDVHWVGPRIHAFMISFTDERDSGPILVTHLSLLLGMAVPIWLSRYLAVSAGWRAGTLSQTLCGACGIAVLGVGDTAASVVGRSVGCLPMYRGAQKTVEGTVAGACCTFLFLWALCMLLGAPQEQLWRLCLGSVAVSISAAVLEAITCQLDNIFVPLYSLAHMMLLGVML